MFREPALSGLEDERDGPQGLLIGHFQAVLAEPFEVVEYPRHRLARGFRLGEHLLDRA
jgi:hypothetical protein